MKTIVICPEVITYHTAAFREPKTPLNKGLIAGLILLPIVAVGGWVAGRSSATPAPVAPIAPIAAIAPAITAPALAITPPAPLIAEDGSVELRTAVDRGLIKADFAGNGREQLQAEISNPGAEPLTIRTSFGQTFTSGRNSMVATRSCQLTLAPGQTGTLNIPAAALRSTNRIGKSTYQLSTRTVPKIDLLLTHAQDHPEFTTPALQTAILALLENLPVSSICKFTAAGSDLPTRFDTTPFRVETLDVMAALQALREIGIRDRDVALTIDPQLKIESMIDPACRAVAMRYYGITSEGEWPFWKKQLLEGDPATRHYALYGIARFYPEIALQMLPTWAREKRTTPIFRLTAVQALCETKRPEALALLSDLVTELGRNTELGRAAFDAAQLLETALRKTTNPQVSVAFRGSTPARPF